MTDPTAASFTRESTRRSAVTKSSPRCITQRATLETAGPMSGVRPRSARTDDWPERSAATTAQHGAGIQVAARSTMSSAILSGSSVVLTARTMSRSASRRSTRLLNAR